MAKVLQNQTRVCAHTKRVSTERIEDRLKSENRPRGLIQMRIKEQRCSCQNSNINQNLNGCHPTQLLFQSILLHGNIYRKIESN